MEKTKKTTTVCEARPEFLSATEQLLLSHVEMCYSVALALTHDPVMSQRLARATLLWAWKQQTTKGNLGGGDIKMALLRNLRDRFIRDYIPACSSRVRRSVPAGLGAKAVKSVGVHRGANHAESGAVR